LVEYGCEERESLALQQLLEEEVTDFPDRPLSKSKRRRTKVNVLFLLRSELKLVFSTLIRRCRRWQRATFTSVEVNFGDT